SPNFGATAAAAHGQRRDFLERRGVGEGDYQRLPPNTSLPCTSTRGSHFRQLVETAHEAPVDPVLPAPDPCAFEHHPVAGSDGISIAGRDQIHRLALWSEGPQR